MDWKLWVSSFVFVSVTIVKLVFPEQTADLRRQAVALIDMDMDYQNAIVAIGSLLTEESVQEVIGGLNEMEDKPDVQFDVRSPIISLESSNDMNVTASEQEVSEDILKRVEAFCREQEAYAEYDLPSNVSYEQLHIPFPFSSPVTAVCSSGFGYRIHPIEGQVLFHYGTDYDVEEGTEVLAFADGVVTALGEESGYGKYICVEHDDGWETLYAHCSEISVSTGQAVSGGEVLGKSGSTGRVTGPHLHFELMHNDLYTNPEFFLP